MKNVTIKNIVMMTAISSLSIAVNISQAGDLIPFSNGKIADANDVNTNFNELATRIESISLTAGAAGAAGATGPQGPIGLTGPQGVSGAQGTTGSQGESGEQGSAGTEGSQGLRGLTGPQGDHGLNGLTGPAGAGVGETFNWRDHFSEAWTKKVFSVKTSESRDPQTEIRDYIRETDGVFFDNGVVDEPATYRTTVVNVQRGSLTPDSYIEFDNVSEHQAFNYREDVESYDFSGLWLSKIDGLDDRGSAQLEVFYPEKRVRNSEMVQGMNWVDVIETTINNSILLPSHVNINSTRLLGANETLLVQGVTYTQCQKFEIKRTSALLSEQFHRIEWTCGNGTGLVKSVQINDDGSSEILEFLPSYSTSCNESGQSSKCWNGWEAYFNLTDGPV